ncbi:ATP-dependent DNA helicase DinG [Evansella sp. AB-P1]|uniref:ATP-dependent DNA helicase DinG n=1 Tax=Evansella sp. AB-P1 TaxID=3037653 RepID=UPI00241EF035|nr:ATP-dependent DNA helicase DinG [Evansella sp. AB-P1]MDG5787562.1 ATP-dependent DNA helicase DinG [Evansella sp. AB-P1]
MERFVIIDVETTGVSFSKGDRIIQIAYVIIENEQVIKRYNSYINPNRKIPPFIKSLTNIDEELVKGAPEFTEVAPILLEALNNGAYFVAHNVEFDLGFINEELSAAGYSPFSGPAIDTVELSRIAFPTADGFRLSQLSESFQVNHNEPHRADSDAEATGQLFIEILKKLSSLPNKTLEQLTKLKGRFKSDVGFLFQKWLMESNVTDKAPYDEYRGLVLKKQKTIEKNEHSNIKDKKHEFQDFFSSCLQNEQWCETKMAGYEARSGQLEMISFIDSCMENNNFGLIEAGTGTGKTLAYLLPAAFQAKKLNQPIVISTHTVQLQEQIVKKELPTLMKFLPFSINVALLKGRGHYLCLRKFENLLHHDPIDTYERTISKAQILIWLIETETGDVEELSLASRSSRFWNDISSDSFSCVSPKCPWFSRCYYQRAKLKAREADIIITNHSLVLSDIMAEHQLIPSYKHIILDESHHFEETATDQLGLQINYLTLTHLLNELSLKDSDGLLSTLSEVTKKESPLIDIIYSVEENGKKLKQEWNDLYLLLFQYVYVDKEKYNERGRAIKKLDLGDSSCTSVNEASERCQMYFGDFLQSLNHLNDMILEKGDADDFKGKSQIINTLNLYVQRIRKVNEAFVHLLVHHDPTMIYWLEAETKGPKQSVFIQGRPINVAEHLADTFFSKKDSVIFTSATLTVNNKFQYIIQRLGLEDFPITTKVVQSPFRWKEQVQLMIPTDMPLIQDAGEQAYIEAAVLQIFRIAEITKGKMLVLFTSYDMLKKSYHLLKEMLSDEIVLIAQGIQTGSRSKLTKNFQQFDQAILLGTSSFWEGVDIPGSDLSVIVIVRLPFSPPDDPVFQAKSSEIKEAGGNPFMKLALPQAVLRFKQGFGRLIRRSSDRGVVVVLDRRIKTTRYGSSFIKSLPSIPIEEKPMDELENDLSNWL